MKKMKKNDEIQTDGNKTSKVKWGLLIVIVVLLAFGASAAGTIVSGKYFTGSETKPKAEEAEKGTAISKKQRLVNVKKFIVNLATDDPADLQYIRLKVSLLVADDQQAET